MDILTDVNDNYYTGWIRLFRSIRSHWIWKDEKKLKWWLDILLEVNHSDKKVSIGYKTFDCKRGESLLSLLSWGERWNVSKTVVNNFMNQLEKDRMIETVNETVTTRLIVCNYDSYQCKENAFKTDETTEKNATVPQQSTNNNDNNNKNEEEINNIYNIYPSKCPISSRSSGKSSKDKEKIGRLLKKGIMLKPIIERYVKECTETKTYIKNFSTFLNNVPDYGDIKEPNKEVKKYATYEDMMKPGWKR